MFKTLLAALILVSGFISLPAYADDTDEATYNDTLSEKRKARNADMVFALPQTVKKKQKLKPYAPTGEMKAMLKADEMAEQIALFAYDCSYDHYGSGGYSASGNRDEYVLYCPVKGNKKRMVPSRADIAVVDIPEVGLVNFDRHCEDKRNTYLNELGASFDQVCREHGYRREVSFVLVYLGQDL